MMAATRVLLWCLWFGWPVNGFYPTSSYRSTVLSRWGPVTALRAQRKSSMKKEEEDASSSSSTTSTSSSRKKKKTLVIVESPAKARTIQKFFPATKPGKAGGEGEEVLVDFCLGHIRDLMKQRDIPKDMKKENPDW